MQHKVLIAEDESRMREVIAMLLCDLPLDFVEAGDGQEAAHWMRVHLAAIREELKAVIR